jgi:hypothetical protein
VPNDIGALIFNTPRGSSCSREIWISVSSTSARIATQRS